MFCVQKEWNRLSITRRRQRPLLSFWVKSMSCSAQECLRPAFWQLCGNSVLRPLFHFCCDTFTLWQRWDPLQYGGSGIRGSLTTALSNVFEMAGKTKCDAGPNYPQFLADNMWKSNQVLKRLRADQFGRADHFNLNNFPSHLKRFCIFVYFAHFYILAFFQGVHQWAKNRWSNQCGHKTGQEIEFRNWKQGKFL